MIPVSQAFLDAAASGDQTVITEAQVWSEPTATTPAQFLASLGSVSAGSWTEDMTQQVRRTCTLVVESQGLDYDDLVPVRAGDLLHPVTANELRLFRGFQYADGSQELAPCGVYRMSKPDVEDTGSEVQIAISGNDRSAQVSRASWTEPWVIAADTPIDAAIQALVNSRFPGLDYNLVPSDFLLPATTFGTQLGSGTNDPFADAVSLAQSGGYELFFDANGVLVMRVMPDPTTTPVQLSIADDEEGVFTSRVARTLDETQTYNGVIAISTASGTTQLAQQAVWVTDPTSPIYPPRYGYFPYFLTSPLFTSTEQMVAAATAQLQLLLTALDEVNFNAVPNPALTAGDILGLSRARIGIGNPYAAQTITMPGDVKTAMQVTCVPRSTAA